MNEDKTIYVMNSRPRIFIDGMRERGFNVLVGEDKLDEEKLASCWAFWCGRCVITEEVLQKAPNLKLIVKQGVGLDRVDIDACTAHGVMVANTPRSNYISVSEHTMFLLFATARKLTPVFQYLHAGGPDYRTVDRDIDSVDLCGKKLSVIGLGRIGMRVSELAHAFGMEITGYDMFRRQEDLPDYVKLVKDMDEAVREADFLTLHVSGTESNRGMIGKKQFEMMKPSAVLINTTRGFVVDEDALYDALVNREIAGAGIDVCYSDPISPDNRLLKLTNVVATPHIAANTVQASERACEECIKIVTDFAAGLRPESAANL